MMDADLTCVSCAGKGWMVCPVELPDCHHRCGACDTEGHRRPSLAEWDALRAERDRYHEALIPFARLAAHVLDTNVTPGAHDDERLPARFQLPPSYTTVGDLRRARAALDRGDTVRSRRGGYESTRPVEDMPPPPGKPEPTPTELIHQLHEALYGVRSPARDDSPKVIWEQLLAEVRRLTRSIPPIGYPLEPK